MSARALAVRASHVHRFAPILWMVGWSVGIDLALGIIRSLGGVWRVCVVCVVPGVRPARSRRGTPTPNHPPEHAAARTLRVGRGRTADLLGLPRTCDTTDARRETGLDMLARDEFNGARIEVRAQDGWQTAEVVSGPQPTGDLMDQSLTIKDGAGSQSRVEYLQCQRVAAADADVGDGGFAAAAPATADADATPLSIAVHDGASQALTAAPTAPAVLPAPQMAPGVTPSALAATPSAVAARPWSWPAVVARRLTPAGAACFSAVISLPRAAVCVTEE